MTSAIESGTHLPAAAGPATSGPAAPDPATPLPAYSPAPPPGRIARLFRTLYTRPAWLAPLALLACFGLSVAYVERFNPTTGDAGPTGGCAFKALTGLDCPGCGGTRAFFYLLHGNLPEAARNHLLAVFATPFLVYAYIAWTVNRVLGKPKMPMLRVSPGAIGLFLGSWLAFAVLRNLPWAPFTYLFV
ncbi:DUF2752 domain-containing protein [Actinocatenispora rupis]|uniref:DUF2752 domain-containing protein n=1 Tax=Actinocatenispora rupis TaxID=519421 RepID=A0A8J3J2Z2_9ACTN|nr:DUF2752 domain-containing protein [Actinocatenispora rupis]GID09207.1 hypothetical protein Aru02nite_00960 [Actinocatenispora rupis]